MAPLARFPELVGFFSYSREDDEAFRGSLSALRDAIQRELGAQLGRTKRNFRLWQDQEAIAPGKDWEAEITRAVGQSVFFIPIVTPRAVSSDYCKFEFSSFLARERALGRGDLVFPILYISVPALLDEAEWRNDPVLSIVAKRQYVDWRPFRHSAVDSPALGQAIERFCGKIVETLREPWLSPEERRELEVEARKRAEEEERIRLEAEARRQGEEEERLSKEAQAKKQADEEDAKRRREEAETQRRLAEEAERCRQEGDAKRRAQQEQRQQDERTRAEVATRHRPENEVLQLADVGEPDTQKQPSAPWWPSRRDGMIAGVLVAATAAGAAAWWSQHRLKEEVQPQTAATAPARVIEKEETRPLATAPAPALPAQATLDKQLEALLGHALQSAPATQAPTPVTAPAVEKKETHPPAIAPVPALAAQASLDKQLETLLGHALQSLPATQTQTPVTTPAVANEETHLPESVAALTAAQERALRAGDSFKECRDCPEMVVAPAGRFTMGAPAGKRLYAELPAHEVTIAKPFAIGKFKLTFDEWDACAARGGCRADVSDSRWGRGRRPVINVSWDDAQAYVKWLSSTTGKPYRLLSEAEYEYAGRAGSETAYPWGDDLKLNGQPMANCKGCGSEWDGKQTSPVGSFSANVFGLYDMVGNASEWTEDCWNGTDAPDDGSPSTSGDCGWRVTRSGSWLTNPDLLYSYAGRSAARHADARFWTLGFRVARTLTP
jgi:formylglycine-generating enzyme required for sulfatase activity